MRVRRTERGWKGHFVGAHKCHFSRNTLLEFGTSKLVISTVGAYLPSEDYVTLDSNGNYFETKVFWSDYDPPYFDASVGQEIHPDSPTGVKKLDGEIEADKMHEKVVREISKKLRKGSL